ncbi:MAG TPA: plasmid pRiA4b ORF-3 family protein [Streptosporangiaceae bacterium]|nr:plasmid pRiA4b ORF-3 family protein [Streptosporangiaceae bacterium]
MANSRRPSRPARPTGRTQVRHLYVVPDDAALDEAQSTAIQPELWDSQELRRLAQLRQLAIATGASKETIRLIESATTAEEAMTRLTGTGLVPDEADAFEGMLAWFEPLLEPGCDQLDAEICGSEFVAEMRRAAPPDLDVADVLGEVIRQLGAHQGPAALAMARVLAAVGPAEIRELAAGTAGQLAATGQADMSWATGLGAPKPGACFSYADIYGEQRSIVIPYGYGRKTHAIAVLIDYVLGGGIKDCYPVDYTTSLREDYRKIGAQPDLMFSELDGAQARQILATALSREPCPADPDQAEDVENYLDLLRARVELLPLPPATGKADPSRNSPSAASRTPAPRRPATARNVHRLKVTLRGSKPPIWRRFEVPSDITLARLHSVIQYGFGWEDCHLWVFETPTGRYGSTDPDLEIRSAATKKLSAVADWPGDKLRYEYDFGDGWDHDIVVEAVQPAEEAVAYPRCIAGKRACPPEDCGGVWGYYELLNTLANPRHENHTQMLWWLGISSPADFDPDRFDLDEANSYLARISKVLVKA